MENKRILEVLKKVPLFTGLDKHNLEVLSKVITERHFEAGDTIVHQGESGIGFYVVESGKVEIIQEKGGEKKKLNELGEGEFFGEMALFDETPRTATVVALEPTNCYVITRWNFMGTLESSPTLAIQMLQVVMKRISKNI